MGACDVVILGALGRMGSTLAALVAADSRYRLAGVLERAENASGLSKYACPGGHDLAELLPMVPGATIIDFTAPACSVNTARLAAEHGNPAVIGTTGLTRGDMVVLEAAALATPVFWAPNMSVGINALLLVLPELARKLGPGYDLEIMEIHHNKKADSPSGTAIKLGQCLAEARGQDYEAARIYCREGVIGARAPGEIGVQALRGGDVVGDHTVYFFGPGERVEVTHRAHSRDTLARGALRAVLWLAGQKPGKLYGMADLLG